jgi:hypothetical protein
MPRWTCSLLVACFAALAAASPAAAGCGQDAYSVANVCGVDNTVERGQPFSGKIADASIQSVAHWTGGEVDWGDGTSTESVGMGSAVTGTHTYAAPGTYTVSVTGYGQGNGSLSNLTGQATGTGTMTVTPDSPPKLETLPKVSGRKAPGETLTTDHGTWDPPASSYEYQWQRCEVDLSGCTTIGADEDHLLLTDDEAGKRIRVKVTAINAKGRRSATSYPTVAVGRPRNTAIPIVDGIRQVGETLSTDDGEWSPDTTEGYAYEWLRCNDLGGACEAIENAAASTYTLVEADRGRRIRSRVTAENVAGAVSALSYPTAKVGRPVNAVEPSVSGTTLTGQILTADPGEWSPAAADYKYRWQRCIAGVCTDIDSPDAADGDEDYTLVAEDSRRRVRVVVSAVNGSGTVRRASARTAIVDAPIATTKPSIAGFPEIGTQLTADRGTWSPAPTSWRYHWQRCDADGKNCANIGTADADDDRDYTPVAADADKRLRLAVFGLNAAGPATDYSAPSNQVGQPGPPVATLHFLAGVAAGASFSEPVTGVDAGDFAWGCEGHWPTDVIVGVTPYNDGKSYLLEMNPAVAGPLYFSCLGSVTKLRFVDDDSVTDLAGNPVGGPGAGNGSSELIIR